MLHVTSGGIAVVLLPKGRIAHSRFGIPINVNEDTMCRGIEPNSYLVELLQRIKLIIWDEAPLTHKHCFEALDRCFYAMPFVPLTVNHLNYALAARLLFLVVILGKFFQ